MNTTNTNITKEYITRDEFYSVTSDLKQSILDGFNRIFRLIDDTKTELRSEMNQGFLKVDKRFVEMDQRFISVDNRFLRIENKLINIDERLINVENKVIDTEEKIINIDERVINIENNMVHNHELSVL